MNTVMKLPAWMSGRKKETTVKVSDQEAEHAQWTLEEMQRAEEINQLGLTRENPQWTREELARFNHGGERPPITYPRDLDKVPRPQAEYNRQNSPQKRDIDAITADIRANEAHIIDLEMSLSKARIHDIDLRSELGGTLDEIENLARDARKKYNLEAPDVQPAPTDGPTPGDQPVADDPGSPVRPGSPTHAGASESAFADPRFTPMPHQERGDDEIPF